MIVNGTNVQLIDTAIRKDGTIYMPISELGNVYNIEINMIKETNIVTIDSLDRELIKADVTKDLSIKYKARFLSKTVDKVKKGEKVIFVSDVKDGWAKVRTQDGILGYVKQDKLTNKIAVRETLETKPQIEGKINMFWDYYSEYVKAPDRTGSSIEGVNVVAPSFFSLQKSEDVKMNDNAARGGKEYVAWAKSNDYKVWAMVSNNSYQEVTSKILNDFKLRQKLIEQIIELAVKYDVDGINIDFEYMKMTDKDIFSQFVIELAPRLRELGIVVSVDVTAPDGSENWSLCYNRKILAKAADYLCFMAYDQHGTSSPKAGTVAGCDWVEKNINKFLKQEDVAKEKIILGMPLYTRLWKTDINDKLTSTVVNMNQVSENIPSDAPKTWDEETKQYYVEYNSEKYKFQMWVEDEKSIEEKLKLIVKYDLAGGSYWEKDRETEGIWALTNEILNSK